MNTPFRFSLLALLLTLLTFGATAQQRDTERAELRYVEPLAEMAAFQEPLRIDTGTQLEQANFLQTMATTYQFNEYELIQITKIQRQAVAEAEAATTRAEREAAFARFEAKVNEMLTKRDSELIAKGR